MMGKRFRMWLIATRIELKWKKIMKNRRKMEQLIGQEEPFTSPRLIELNQQTISLGFTAKRLEKEYLQLDRAV